MPGIAGWDNFYVIVGSAAGALIGLQFVVMTLVAERPPAGVRQAGQAFGTPTIVHFTVVLGLAAILCAPWPANAPPSILCMTIGLAGAVYVVVVAYRMQVQTVYRPDSEDWVFHCLAPFVAYAVLSGGAAGMFFRPHEALFAIAAATLLLLLTGIHNAWDAVAFHVASNVRRKEE